MPGRINKCFPATIADSVLRGSTKYNLAPRASRAFSFSDGLGTWRKDHFEITGFAPTMIRQFVFSRSGKGRVNGNPYMCRDTANLLEQSCVAEAYMLFDPMPVINPWAKTGCNTPNPAAVPTYMAMESGPSSARNCFTLAPISCMAWSQEIRT